MRTITLHNETNGLDLVAHQGRIVGGTEPIGGGETHVLLADGEVFVCHNFTAAAINRWVAGGEV